MKQISIFASPDLERQVVDVLERAGVEGFLRLGGATGNRFASGNPLSRTLTWEAVALIVPAAEAEKASAVVRELRAYADACGTRPCLRVVVAAVDEVV